MHRFSHMILRRKTYYKNKCIPIKFRYIDFIEAFLTVSVQIVNCIAKFLGIGTCLRVMLRLVTLQ